VRRDHADQQAVRDQHDDFEAGGPVRAVQEFAADDPLQRVGVGLHAGEVAHGAEAQVVEALGRGADEHDAILDFFARNFAGEDFPHRQGALRHFPSVMQPHFAVRRGGDVEVADLYVLHAAAVDGEGVDHAGIGVLEMGKGLLLTAGAINGAGTLISGGLHISSDTNLNPGGQFNFSGGDAWIWAIDDINVGADFVTADTARTLYFMPDSNGDSSGLMNINGSGAPARLIDLPGGEVLVSGVFNVYHPLSGGNTATLDIQGAFNQGAGADITGFAHVGISQLTGNLSVGNILVDVPAGGYNPGSPAGVIALEAYGGDIVQQSGTTLSEAGIGAVSYDGSVLLTEDNPPGIVLGQATVDFHFNSISPVQVVSYDDGTYSASGIFAGNSVRLTSTTSDITVNAPIGTDGTLLFSTPTRTVINDQVYTGAGYANDGTIKIGAGAILKSSAISPTRAAC
jgi:hypothetical protein